MAAYEINLNREVTLNLNRENNIIMLVKVSNVILIPFNIKMHIHYLSFTNPRIINECELPFFYDVQSPINSLFCL